MAGLALGVRGQLVFGSKNDFSHLDNVLCTNATFPPRPAGSYECVDPRWCGVALTTPPLCAHKGHPPPHNSAPSGRPLSAVGNTGESGEMGPSSEESYLHSQHSPQRAQEYGRQE